jgi:hypothetical protein
VGLEPRLARALVKSTKSSGLTRAPFLGAQSTTSRNQLPYAAMYCRVRLNRKSPNRSRRHINSFYYEMHCKQRCISYILHFCFEFERLCFQLLHSIPFRALRAKLIAQNATQGLAQGIDLWPKDESRGSHHQNVLKAMLLANKFFLHPERTKDRQPSISTTYTVKSTKFGPLLGTTIFVLSSEVHVQGKIHNYRINRKTRTSTK